LLDLKLLKDVDELINRRLLTVVKVIEPGERIKESENYVEKRTHQLEVKRLEEELEVFKTFHDQMASNLKQGNETTRQELGKQYKECILLQHKLTYALNGILWKEEYAKEIDGYFE
jgi:hypothetical protein